MSDPSVSDSVAKYSLELMWRPAAVVVVFVLTACGPSDSSGHDAEDQSPAVRTAVRVAESMVDGDGPSVCAFLYREAQEALMKKYRAENCIDAVERAEARLSANTRAALGQLSDARATVKGGVATLDGPGTRALAEVLNLPSVALSEFEGDWTIQGSAAEPAIKANL